MADDWDFSEPGNYRLVLRDIQLTAVGGVKWDVTMQLIAHEDHLYDRGTGEWLPDIGDTHHFFLTKGNMWGREVGGGRGGQGGRQSCHKDDSGIEENMEGFFLWNPDCGDEACKHEATSVMEIVIPPPPPL